MAIDTQRELKILRKAREQGKSDDFIRNVIRLDRQRTEPTPAVQPQERQERVEAGLPTGIGGRAKPTVLGGIARDIARPFARVAVTAAQLPRALAGKELQKTTRLPLLGDVRRLTGPGDIDPATGKPISALKGALDPAGVGAEIGGTIFGGGGAGQAARQVGKGLFRQAVKTGVRGGAGAGLLTGAGIGAQEEAPTARGIVGGGLGGAVVGGAAGGVLAGLGSQVSKILARRTSLLPKIRIKQLEKEAAELITPDVKTLKPLERIQAGEQGRLVKPTLFKRGAVTPSPRDKEVSETVAGVIRRNKSLNTNISSIDKEIAKKAKELDILIEKETIAPITNEQLQGTFQRVRGESDFIFAGEKAQENAYDSIINLFTRELDKAGGNHLQARRNLDAVVRKKFPGLLEKIAKGEIGDRARTQAVADIRQVVNDAVADSLPKGNILKQSLRDQANMFMAKKSLVKNSLQGFNESQVQAFFKSPAGRVVKNIGFFGAGALGISSFN